jgi:hypothetical protein
MLVSLTPLQETDMGESEARITRLEQGVQIIRQQGATKVDLAELKAELVGKLAILKADILVRLAEVEGGLKLEMSALRAGIERSQSRLSGWIVLVVLLGQLVPVLLKHARV